MKNLVFFFVFLFVANHLQAQAQTIVRSPDRASEITATKLQMAGTIALTDFSSRVASDKLLNELGVEGSPYAKEDSSMGFFYLGKQVIKTPTRLNYYLNSFEFMSGGKLYVATATTIDSVIVDSTTYVYRSFKFKGETQSRVVKVIGRQGKNAMYMYRGAEFIQEVKPGPLVDYRKPHFEWNSPMYLFEIGNKLIMLNTFTELMETFPGKEIDIKKFIKYNRISKNDPDELKKLLDYVSQL